MLECGDLLERHGFPHKIDFVCAEAKENEWNMHAEMIAVSERLNGNHPKPVRIGANRAICGLCHQVLQHLGITEYNVSKEVTPNWGNPWSFNDRATPIGLNVPKFRSKGKDY